MLVEFCSNVPPAKALPSEPGAPEGVVKVPVLLKTTTTLLPAVLRPMVRLMVDGWDAVALKAGSDGSVPVPLTAVFTVAAPPPALAILPE